MPAMAEQSQVVDPMYRHARFKQLTRRNRTVLPAISWTANAFTGVTQAVQLPQVGLLSKIWIRLSGSVTFGASSSGTVSTRFPFNLLRNLVLRSNEGAELYRTDGFHNLLVQRVSRLGFDPAVNYGAITNLNRGYSLANTGAEAIVQFTSLAPGTAFPTSGTLNFEVVYMIPVAIDDNLSAGLLLLQNQQTRAELSMQGFSLADFGGTSLGTAGQINATTATVELEFFSPPVSALPDLTFLNRIVTEDIPWTVVGDQIYDVPVNNVIYRVLREYLSAGTSPQAFMAANNPNSPNFTQAFVQYAGTQRPEISDALIHLYRNEWQYGWPLPDGVFCHEFSLGGGSVERMFDPRDVYDTADLTQFRVGETYSGSAPSANSLIRTTRFELAQRAA